MKPLKYTSDVTVPAMAEALKSQLSDKYKVSQDRNKVMKWDYVTVKAHGMAGMRIGYALTSHDLIAGFNKVRIQFGVNRLAQIGALASLRDPAFVAQVVDEVSHGRADYERIGRELGVRTLESHTNFVSFDFESSERAETVLTELLRRGVFVRSGAPPFDRLVRVTVGTKAERATFEPIFRSVVNDS